MRKYYSGLIVAIGLALLVGCHTTNNGMEFLQLPSNDASITAAVEDGIHKNHMLDRSKIKVTTMNHMVTLSGRVKTIRQSDTAADIARKTPGVTSVQNDIIVRK